MNKYNVKKIDSNYFVVNDGPIPKGARKKVMLIDKTTKAYIMFKYEREDYNCSEACSEKIAYEIARILNYECAKIELAVR